VSLKTFVLCHITKNLLGNFVIFFGNGQQNYTSFPQNFLLDQPADDRRIKFVYFPYSTHFFPIK